jgi:adenylyltransferase/sulfurtransferase
MLNQDEINRYHRHIQLSEIGIEGQEKLKQSKVLVIGAGGLGCPVLQYLTAAGVGTLGIVDFDKVDESNLQRQILYGIDDIGKPKVECAVNRLSQQNPFVKFISHNIQLTNQNAIDIINNYDIIIDGTDNFPTRYLVNDACVLLNKPLVYGSINKFEGQVSVFNYLINETKRSATYRCLFPNPPSAADVPNCSEVGVLGVLPGIIGTLQANETIKIITEIGDVLSGKLLILNALSMQFYTIAFTRDNTVANSITLEQFKKNDYELFCNGSVLKNNENSNDEITAAELYRLLTENRNIIQLIDVREIGELPFVDSLKELHIPLNEISKNKHRIDSQKKIIVFCKSGARSKIAIQKLQAETGINNLYNLKGGVVEWLKNYK